MHSTVKNILVLGGTGFIGRHLVSQLAKQHYRITLPSRNPELHKSLSIIPNLSLIKANCHDPNALMQLSEQQDAIINLIGIYRQKNRADMRYQQVHQELAQKIVNACYANKIKKLIQFSVLNANAKHASSEYLRSRGKAEDIMHNAADETLSVCSIKPSLVYGPDDHCFCLFARLLKQYPYYAPICYPQTQFSPVYVGDVVTLVSRLLNDSSSTNQRHQVFADKKYTLQNLIEYCAELMSYKRRLIPLSPLLSKLMPGANWLSKAHIHGLQTAHTLNSNISALKQFGLSPTVVEAQVPVYLANRNQRARYAHLRQQIGLYG